jgi:D-alanyl-D-alanine dipeptidase
MPDLVPISAHGLLGKSFYWYRYADYGFTLEDLMAAGVKDDLVYVAKEIIPALLRVDMGLQQKGWRLYLKEGYRSPEVYKLVYESRIKKYGQEMTDKLLNIKDMPHAKGTAVDVAIWNPSEDKEIYLRKSGDGPESLIVDFYKDAADPEGQKCQELQEYLRSLMVDAGFKLGTRNEYFHFEFKA